MPKPFKIISACLLFIALAYLGIDILYPPTPKTVTSVQSSGKSAIGGPFTLINMDGREITEQNLLGKYSLIYFGFTNCPDICPTSLQTIALAMAEIDPKQAESLQPIFITLDPERDTADLLKEYVTYFHPSFWGLGGSDTQVKAAAKAYRVYYKVQEHESGESYAVDHSGYLYFMNPKGEFITHFSHDTSVAQMVEKLQKILPTS